MDTNPAIVSVRNSDISEDGASVDILKEGSLYSSSDILDVLSSVSSDVFIVSVFVLVVYETMVCVWQVQAKQK